VISNPQESLEFSVEQLKKAIENDKASGLIPFYVVATCGTTSTTAVDPLAAIGKLCK
jgi:aromatic-L-amino-acid decarboxylase